MFCCCLFLTNISQLQFGSQMWLTGKLQIFICIIFHTLQYGIPREQMEWLNLVDMIRLKIEMVLAGLMEGP